MARDIFSAKGFNKFSRISVCSGIYGFISSLGVDNIDFEYPSTRT